MLINKKELDTGYILENIVYLELVRRGCKVFVGNTAQREAIKNCLVEYYQVSLNMSEDVTFNREISPLRRIKDNYKKVILTLDNFSTGNYDTIEVINIIDWLLI